jgi:hypothetical protein
MRLDASGEVPAPLPPASRVRPHAASFLARRAILSPTREQLRRVRCALPGRSAPARNGLSPPDVCGAAGGRGAVRPRAETARTPRPASAPGGPAQGMRAYLFGSVFAVRSVLGYSIRPLSYLFGSVFGVRSVLGYSIRPLSQVCVVGYGCGALSHFLGSTPHTHPPAPRAPQRARARLSRARAPRELSVPLVGVTPPPAPPVLSGHAASPTPY